MSLITRCTACGTLFKVVPDQLKMGDGWVRCGHCAEVFDAAAHLQALATVPEGPRVRDEPPPSFSAAPSSVPVPEPVSEPWQQSAAGTAASTATATPAVDVLLDDAAPVDEDRTPDFASASVQQPWQSHEDQGILVSDPSPQPVNVELRNAQAFPPEGEEDTPSPLLLHTATHDGVLDTDVSVLEPDGITIPADTADGAEAAPHNAADFSFVRQAERKAFWRRPLVRCLLLLLSLGLIGVLGFQAVIQHRDEIAARVPSLRVVLEQACQHLGCEVSARRHIESIVIDSSAFNKTRGDTYQLSLTLKNTASTALATPSIELTLTDAQDQALLRRVLQPADLGVAAELPAHGDANVSLPIGVAGEAGSARIAGYRLLAFYP